MDCTLMHKNISGMLTKISNTFANKGINIENMLNKSKGDMAYTILDVLDNFDPAVTGEIEKIDGVIKVRVIN